MGKQNSSGLEIKEKFEMDYEFIQMRG